MIRSLLLALVMSAGACERWGSDAPLDESPVNWRIKRTAVPFGIDQTTGDVFAVIFDPGPTLVRLASADGSRRWSTTLPDEAAPPEAGVHATLAGLDVVVLVHQQFTFDYGSLSVPGGSSTIRFSREDGRALSANYAPLWRRDPDSGYAADFNRPLFAGARDGSVVRLHCEEPCRGDVAVYGPTGTLDWAVSVPAASRIVAVGFTPEDDVIVAAFGNSPGTSLIRLRRIDGSVVWSASFDGAASSIAIFDATLYSAGLTNSGGSVMAMDASDGRSVWAETWYFAGELMYVTRAPAITVDADGRPIATVHYQRSLDYDGEQFGGQGSDTIVAVLDPLDAGLVDWRVFKGDGAMAWTVGNVIGGASGRVYIGGTSLQALEIP